jgi:hypothetical protein
MKIMILSYAAGLTEILSGKLKDFGLIASNINRVLHGEKPTTVVNKTD